MTHNRCTIDDRLINGECSILFVLCKTLLKLFQSYVELYSFLNLIPFAVNWKIIFYYSSDRII